MLFILNKRDLAKIYGGQFGGATISSTLNAVTLVNCFCIRDDNCPSRQCPKYAGLFMRINAIRDCFNKCCINIKNHGDGREIGFYTYDMDDEQYTGWC